MHMGFFRKLLGQQDKPPAVPANATPIPAAAPRRIGYDAKLIQSLLQDHAELGRIFGNIGDAQQAGNFGDIRPLLIQFKTRLEAHVLTENVRFYNYLEQSLANDANNAGTMHSFRREMNGIARSVVEFVKKYQSSNFMPEERRQFATDYDAVGKVLEQRLDSEENNLYPLYQPG
jgi:hypothetical protein